jgi:hypothetical protein
MALDRNRLAQLLGQFGESRDEIVLMAAREAHRLVSDSGRDWNEVLGGGGIAAPAPEPATTTAATTAPGEKSSDQRLVDRLLTRSDISDTLRGDLEDFKRQLASGKLDPMDSDYLRALAKRLGV